jgi:two-component system, chemotaxis family, chemotaxis protein CheY
MSKILVVDDSGTMRKIVIRSVKAVATSLGKNEPDFLEAGDGIEALALLEGNDEIDLILCDIKMPNMDGIQFVRAARDQRSLEKTNVGDMSILKRVHNHVPIVMVATDMNLDVVQRALAAGANDYLKKPFTPEQLAEKIGTLLP